MTPTDPDPVAGRPVWRQIIALAWPALVQQGLLLAIQLYDQYLTGVFSESHKAALTTANYLYWFVTSYAVVVTAGATALVGRLVGGRDLPLARRAAGQAVLLAAGFGLLGTLIGLTCLPFLITTLGLKDEEARYAVEYLIPLASLLPLYMIEVGGIACLVGAGDTRTGLKVLATVVVVNVPLAWGLSRGAVSWLPDLGFVGIAWGTGLSHVIGCGLVLVTLARGRFGLQLHFADLLPDRSLIYRLLRVSIPAAVDSLSTGVFQLVFLKIVNGLGKTAASAHGIAIRLEGLGYLSGAAFGVATASIIGRALGARRPDLAAAGGWTAFGYAVGVMAAMGAIFYTFARPMFELFCPPDQAEVVDAGVEVLRLVAFAMPGLAASIVLTQALRGAGDTRVPVLFTWVGFLGVRIPLAYLFTQHAGLGLRGAWLAMMADIYVRGLFFLWRFASGKWKQIRV